MKAVIQRVTSANVVVKGETLGAIDRGFLILLGVHEDDTEKEADVVVFVAVLPYSQYIYAEGMLSTKEPQWIEVNNHALEYLPPGRWVAHFLWPQQVREPSDSNGQGSFGGEDQVVFPLYGKSLPAA